MAQSARVEKCPVCTKQMDRQITSIAISGTRDTFGIGKEFVDNKTGKTIDNWRTWEKAGYRDAVEFHKNGDPSVKEGIKRKMKKIRREGTQKMQTTLA